MDGTGPINAAVDATDATADAVADTVDQATSAANDALHEIVRGLSDTLRVTSEAHTQGLASISDRLAAIEVRMVNAVKEAVDNAADIAEEAVDTGAAVPGAATDEIEAVIDAPPAPPVAWRKGILGKKRRRS